MVFDATLRVRGLTIDELEHFKNEPELQRTVVLTVTAIRRMNAAMPQN